ncbi:uncharacterized protein B0H18DRAFT_1040099 [Fomitopsis serialis]|uniref:uncharacterized protein n=1 Tax=Fomitopsis serialis TaxID=139415 RepID=UPI0020084794|nr:uncharacterized protein B0H18DRAFT_1040099 [Neoantrodia serialis]KAH9915832.1 hypothetical protein B0H18DRAFT_1040099 [Neoantrodia serialis]
MPRIQAVLSPHLWSSMQIFRAQLVQMLQTCPHCAPLFLRAMGPTWSPRLLLHWVLLLSCISVAVDLLGRHLLSELHKQNSKSFERRRKRNGSVPLHACERIASSEMLPPQTLLIKPQLLQRSKNVLSETSTVTVSRRQWPILSLYVLSALFHVLAMRYSMRLSPSSRGMI